DDQRIALPASSRVAVPLADARRQMWTAVERDDPDVVHALMEEKHGVGRLQEVERAVVRGGQARNDAREAPLVRADGLPWCERALRRPLLADGRPLSLPLGRQRRKAPVRRIDDDRRAARGALLVPVLGTGAGIARPHTCCFVVERLLPYLLLSRGELFV